MRAVVQDAYGSADVLRLAEVDRPELGADEVLVQVRAAGLDRGTWHLMAGQPLPDAAGGSASAGRSQPVPGWTSPARSRRSAPRSPGSRSGDEVFGIGGGSFAEYAVAPEDKLARKPANLTFEQAAVVPVSGLTALQALRDAGRVEAGPAGAGHRRVRRRRQLRRPDRQGARAPR